jgi:hypothetical protein
MHCLIYYHRIHCIALFQCDVSITACSSMVGMRVGFAKVELRDQVKQVGGKWNRRRKVWELWYDRVIALKLEAWIVEDKASI